MMILKVLGLLFASAAATCAPVANSKKVENLNAKVQDLMAKQEVAIQKQVADLNGFDGKNYIKDRLVDFNAQNELCDADVVELLRGIEFEKGETGINSLLTLDALDNSKGNLLSQSRDSFKREEVSIINDRFLPGIEINDGYRDTVVANLTYSGSTMFYFDMSDFYEFNGHGHTWYIMDAWIPVSDVNSSYWWNVENVDHILNTQNDFFEFTVNYYSDTGEFNIHAQTFDLNPTGSVKFTYNYKKQNQPTNSGSGSGQSHNIVDPMPTVEYSEANATTETNGGYNGHAFIGIKLSPDFCAKVYNTFHKLFFNMINHVASGGTPLFQLLKDNYVGILAVIGSLGAVGAAVASKISAAISAVTGYLSAIWEVITSIFDAIPILKVVLIIAGVVAAFAIASILVLGAQKKGFICGLEICSWWPPRVEWHCGLLG